jgi:hypothetical protein
MQGQKTIPRPERRVGADERDYHLLEPVVANVATTRTTIPMIAAKKSLGGDTNVDARIENTNDRGAPFEMAFRPRDRLVADW